MRDSHIEFESQESQSLLGAPVRHPSWPHPRRPCPTGNGGRLRLPQVQQELGTALSTSLEESEATKVYSKEWHLPGPPTYVTF